MQIQAGDEYDFITALAEIIDNSVQSTAHNEANKRNIVITKKDNSLEIEDNGVGMDIEGLKHWCTLGESKPNPVKLMQHLPNDATPASFLTSDISRYGVGSKKAIFNIGSRVTVVTKTKQSAVESQVTLDRDELEQSANPWNQKIKVVPTNTSKNDSYTKFVIYNVKKSYLENYDSIVLRNQLAHIYHYYIFGPKGNSSNSSTKEKEAFNKLNITVDNEAITAGNTNDMETKVSCV